MMWSFAAFTFVMGLALGSGLSIHLDRVKIRAQDELIKEQRRVLRALGFIQQ